MNQINFLIIEDGLSKKRFEYIYLVLTPFVFLRSKKIK